MSRTGRLTMMAALAATTSLALAACGGGDGGDDTGGGDGGSDLELITPGTLTVCSEVPYPPFEIEDSEAPSGYSGFDIDLVQAIADSLELELAVQDVSFDGIQSGTAYASGQCDMGASAITITEDRQANLDFSDPYYDSLQSLLVRTDSGIESIDDLDGVTVGVQQGTTGEAYANENAEGAEIISFTSDGELWPALQAGNIDAILQDQPVNIEHEKADSTYTIVEEYDTDESYGWAFAKGERAELIEAINAALQELRDDGTYKTIYDSYFTAE